MVQHDSNQGEQLFQKHLIFKNIAFVKTRTPFALDPNGPIPKLVRISLAFTQEPLVTVPFCSSDSFVYFNISQTKCQRKLDFCD